MEDLIKEKNLNTKMETLSYKKENYFNITIKGKLVYSTQKEAKEKLLTLSSANNCPAFIHLSDVVFIDSTGLAVLIFFIKRQKEKNQKTAIIVNNSLVEKLLEIAKFKLILPIFKKEEEAKEWLAQS